MLPSVDSSGVDKNQVAVDDSFTKLLKTLRHDDATKHKKKKAKVFVVPGKVWP